MQLNPDFVNIVGEVGLIKKNPVNITINKKFIICCVQYSDYFLLKVQYGNSVQDIYVDLINYCKIFDKNSLCPLYKI
jgi:hypothetical protein